MSGNFVFTKLNVHAIDTLERFYCTLFGMEVITRVNLGEGEGAMDERILTKPGTRGPQLILFAQPGRPLPPPGESVLGLMVEDVERTLAEPQALGARVLHPLMEVPEHGLKLVYITDPEGHVVELLQSLPA